MALDKMEKIGIGVTALLYGATISVNFDDAVKATFTKAFGPTLLGLPVAIGFSIVETILLFPMPVCIMHMMKLAKQATDDNDGMLVGKLSLLWFIFTAGNKYPELRLSQLICLSGIGYFSLLMLAWILYAAYRGI